MAKTDAGRRILYEVDLEPVGGSRFQPTGFPDVGAAEFDRPVRRDGEIVWTKALVVESAQSMANRLEETAWDRAAQRPVRAVDALPYVRVIADDDERYITSSRTEPHRLASAYVRDSTLDGKGMVDVVRERLALRDDTPLAPSLIAQAVFRLDPFCLLHGVFFSDKRWPGQPKLPRAVSAFVEAWDIRSAVSGGVKKDDVRHGIEVGLGGSSEGYGFVPYHRTEYTAGLIKAFFSVDRAQIASYGLGDAGADLLEALALWEIRSLLDGALRFRTACDLRCPSEVSDDCGNVLPSMAELNDRVRSGIKACAPLLDGADVITVRWGGGKKKPKAT